MRNAPRRDHVWLAAFAAPLVGTLVLCSYMEGRTVESLRQSAKTHLAVVEAHAEANYWKHRYEGLADSAGEVSILEASIREEQGKQ